MPALIDRVNSLECMNATRTVRVGGCSDASHTGSWVGPRSVAQGLPEQALPVDWEDSDEEEDDDDFLDDDEDLDLGDDDEEFVGDDDDDEDFDDDEEPEVEEE